MNTSTHHLQVLNQFRGDMDLSQQIVFDHMDLSPPLVLAAALMFMMAADGEIKEAESSQLQSVLGNNEELLACAASYVQSVPLETFLLEAAESLSSLDKLCILTNVCDSFLADGQAEDHELQLFSRICEAFGFDESTFESHLKTIQIKNDKSALGRYKLAAVLQPQGRTSNHLALAACLVYMMASDGSIGAEEIGRLQAVIGEFEGLQSAALKYVLKVKNAQFMKEIAPTLEADVKLLILTNVCDVLLADGVVEVAEKKLFTSMLTAFGHSEKSFRSYYDTLQIKNVKSFDLNDFSESAAAQLFRSAKYQASQAAFQAASAGHGDRIDTLIHKTMEENLASVSQNAGGKDNIHMMSANANNRQENIQKIDARHREENIQYVEQKANLTGENIQYVDSAFTQSPNVQKLDAASGRDRSTDSMDWDAAQGQEGMSAYEAPNSLDDPRGKGGLTTMAQGEVSYRERAMQQRGVVTNFAGGGNFAGAANGTNAMDAATLQTRLQDLKQRNAEVESKISQLQASAGQLSFATGREASPVASATQSASSGQVSVLQRLNQVVSERVQKMAVPRPAQPAYGNAALT